MDVYIENLTLANWPVALFHRMRGRRVKIFAQGRILRKFPPLRSLARPFEPADYQVGEFPDLIEQIHITALQAADELSRKIELDNHRTLNSWSRAFKTRRVQLYIKKTLANESWPVIRDYMLLSRRVQTASNGGTDRIHLVVEDTPINQMIVPFLLQRESISSLTVSGLSRFPWRQIQGILTVIQLAAEYFAWVFVSVCRRGLVRRSNPRSYQVSKEILWGIGPARRNDDFLVDGEKIEAQGFLLYYKGTSAARSTVQLQDSISTARGRGYVCVDFDKTPITLAFLMRTLLNRYMMLPLAMMFFSGAKVLFRPSAAWSNRTVLAFFREAMVWEIFLSSYRPNLNISFDDPLPSHIAATVALNLHGAKNAGVQWGDPAERRAVTIAYFGYDYYFAWGPLPGEFWQGNWEVDELVSVGYLWGHQFQESIQDRERYRKSLLQNDESIKHVVALFDEPPSPDTATSEQVLFDFYQVGMEILNRRSDTMVVAKPKRVGAILRTPELSELMTPYLESGRFKILDPESIDATHAMAISDASLSSVMSAPYLEALCCRRAGFSYVPFAKGSSPMSQAGFGKVIFNDREALLDAIDDALDNPVDDPAACLNGVIDRVDPFRDYRAIDRMRDFIFRLPSAAIEPGKA